MTSYTSECEKARQESLNRLVENARKISANVVVSVDFEMSDILQGTATVFQRTEQQSSQKQQRRNNRLCANLLLSLLSGLN